MCMYVCMYVYMYIYTYIYDGLFVYEKIHFCFYYYFIGLFVCR